MNRTWFWNEGAPDAEVHGVGPKDDVRVRIKVDGLDALLVEDDLVPLARRRVERHHLAAVGEDDVPRRRRFAHARHAVGRIEARPALAFVRSYQPIERKPIEYFLFFHNERNASESESLPSHPVSFIDGTKM